MSNSTSTLTVGIAPAKPTLRLIQTAAYFAAFIALGLSTGSLGPTLQALAKQSHVSLGMISYLFTARSLGYVLGSTKGAKLFDRRAGNPIMAAMLVLMSAMMALTPLTASFWFLVAAMFLLGTGEATLDAGANTLLVWAHGSGAGPVMNGLHSCFGVGALAAPLIVAAVIATNQNPVATYFILALLVLPVAAALFQIPSPMAQSMAASNSMTVDSRSLVLLLTAFLLLYVGAEVGFGGWIFAYSATLRLGTPASAAFLTTVFWAALTLGRLVAVPLARRLSPVTIIFVDLAGSLLSVTVIIFTSHSFAGTLLGTIGIGLFMASIFPSVMSFAGIRLQLTGALTGRLIVGASIGAMTVPLLIGQLFERLGPQVVMFVVAAALAIAVAIMVCIVRLSSQSVRLCP